MLVLLLGITPPGINNSVEYAAYREADTALWYDSGNSQKSGRFQPERVAALNRITRQVYSGMGGSFAPDFPLTDKENFSLLHVTLVSQLLEFFPQKQELISALDIEDHYSIGNKDTNFMFTKILVIQCYRDKYDQPKYYRIELNDNDEITIKTKSRYLDLIKKQKRTSKNTIFIW
jgi:hypothetical protein